MKQWWRRFRNLDRVAVLTDEIQRISRDHAQLSADHEQLRASIDREREKRIAAELLASTRLRNIETLESEIKFCRDEVSRVTSERLKSLDALNQRLLEPRVEPPPPDINKFKRMTAEQSDKALGAIRQFRQINNDIDRALFGKYYPQFVARVVPNPAENSTEHPTENPVAEGVA